MSIIRTLSGLSLGIACAFALSACGSGNQQSAGTFKTPIVADISLSDVILSTAPAGESFAAWVDADHFVVVTYGSSSCPPRAASLSNETDPQSLTLTLAPPTKQACTMDYSPRAWEFKRLDGMDSTKPATIAIIADEDPGVATQTLELAAR